VGDIGGDLAGPRAADADAAFPARMVAVALRLPRLGVGDVDDVVPVDIDAARPAELAPDIQQLAVLVEDRDAVVPAVADEQPPAAVQGDGVRHLELSRCAAARTPLLDELATGVELDDPGRALPR